MTAQPPDPCCATFAVFGTSHSEACRLHDPRTCRACQLAGLAPEDQR